MKTEKEIQRLRPINLYRNNYKADFSPYSVSCFYYIDNDDKTSQNNQNQQNTEQNQ
jgi:hypothetical protein